MTGFDDHFVVKAELFGAFAEACSHFEVEKNYGFNSHHLFLLGVLLEADAVGHAPSPLYDLIYHIVSDRTILKAYYVHHTVRLHRILRC